MNQDDSHKGVERFNKGKQRNGKTWGAEYNGGLLRRTDA